MCIGYLTELRRPEDIVVLVHFVPVGKLHFMRISCSCRAE